MRDHKPHHQIHEMLKNDPQPSRIERVTVRDSLKTTHRICWAYPIREFKSLSIFKVEKAIKPHDRLVLVG